MAVIFVLVVGGGLGGTLLLRAFARARDETRRMHCRNNLNVLAKGMATYLNQFGDNRYYPFPIGQGHKPGTYTGGEWLATLYWTGLETNPNVFLCPSTADTNTKGVDLGDTFAPEWFAPETVSYAGMGHGSACGPRGNPIAVRDDAPPNQAMACDDSEGSPNHPEGSYPILFFDSHVEFLVPEGDDLEAVATKRQIPLIKTEKGFVLPVGQPGSLLEHLRN